jgi:type IV secretory pathway VirB4 component
MNNYLKEKLQTEKELFELVNNIGEGLHSGLHIIDVSEYSRGEKYRVYHSEGYCFNTEKIEVDLADDEQNSSAIDGYEYSYCDDLFDGFKKLSVEQAVILVQNYNR